MVGGGSISLEDSVMRRWDGAPLAEEDAPARSSLEDTGVMLRELSGEVVNVGGMLGKSDSHHAGDKEEGDGKGEQ